MDRRPPGTFPQSINPACPPSLPHTTGPTPVLPSVAVTTAAPAPSAKMMEVPRSAGSMRSLMRSAASISTVPAAPVRMSESAVDRA